MRLNRDFYIPTESKFATNIEKVEREGLNAEVYLYTNQSGKPAAACFGGKRAKPDQRYFYPNEATRQDAVRRFFNKEQAAADYKKEKQAERKSKGRGLDIGDYLCCSWGYDQTNINFYKVVGLKGKTMVAIIPVGSKLVSSEPPCDKVVPSDSMNGYDVLLRQEDGEPVNKVAKDGAVSLNDHQRAYKWDGKPEYETSAGWGH